MQILQIYENASGKEVLLKAVATAIPAYNMSCFLLPKRVLNQMTKAMRKFWWSSAKDKQGIPWKVAHNSISTAENLHKRKMVADSTCQLCGEHQETTNHLIFQCRVSKEIWSMTPSIQIPSDNLLSNSLIENMVHGRHQRTMLALVGLYLTLTEELY